MQIDMLQSLKHCLIIEMWKSETEILRLVVNVPQWVLCDLGVNFKALKM